MSFRVPAKPHEARDARDRVAAFALEAGVRLDELPELLTAFGEALANAIEHARAPLPIEVQCRVRRDRMIATVTDAGVGFDAQRLLQAATLPGAEAEAGRGIPIMRRCCEIFSIHSEPGRGTTVVLGRYMRPLASTGGLRGRLRRPAAS